MKSKKSSCRKMTRRRRPGLPAARRRRARPEPRPEVAAAEEEIEAEEVFYEDEIKPAVPAEPDETSPVSEPACPKEGGTLESASGPGGDPAAAGSGEEELVIETEALFYEDEIEELVEEAGTADHEKGDIPPPAPVDATALEEVLAADDIEEVELLEGEEVEMVPEGGEESPPSDGDGEPGGTPAAGTADTMGLLEVLSGLMGDGEAPAPTGPAGGSAGSEPYLTQLLSRFAPRHLAIPAGSYQVGSLTP
jgi:hypothetical protein